MNTTVPIEVSARHAHLNAADWQKLFGTAAPTVARPISQHPQFVAVERLQLRGPKGLLENIGVVGPLRAYTQVELAMTDAIRLGLLAPLSDSGRLDQAAEITLMGPKGEVTLPAAIIQQRHLHCNPEEAKALGLTDRQIVSVAIGGDRGGVLDNILVRIHPNFVLTIHLDTDEANALGCRPGTVGTILRS